jgi:thioesterase domain-containing protein
LLLVYFRRQALKSWQPVPIQGAVFLAISEEQSYSMDQWSFLCPQANVVRLPGKHVQVLEPPSLEVLLADFEKAAQSPDFGRPLC